MNNKIAVTLASTAIVASIIYLAFTAIALAYYPQTYSPLTNWLSDLGNPTVNPSGALYYDAGGVVTSVALIFFFMGMYTWRLGDKKAKTFLLASQIAGIALALCFIMTAVFPLGVNTSVHSTFSVMLFVFIGFFEIFSASAARRNKAFPKTLSVFGFAVAIVNFGLAVSFNFGDFFFGEWLMVGLFIAYTFTLSAVQSHLLTNSQKGKLWQVVSQET